MTYTLRVETVPGTRSELAQVRSRDLRCLISGGFAMFSHPLVLTVSIRDDSGRVVWWLDTSFVRPPDGQ